MYSLTASQYAELQDIYVCIWIFIWYVSTLHILTFGGGWINLSVFMYGSWIIYERYKLVQQLDGMCYGILDPLHESIDVLDKILEKN